MTGTGSDGLATVAEGVVPWIKILDKEVGFSKAGFAIGSVFLSAELVYGFESCRDWITDMDEVAWQW